MISQMIDSKRTFGLVVKVSQLSLSAAQSPKQSPFLARHFNNSNVEPGLKQKLLTERFIVLTQSLQIL